MQDWQNGNAVGLRPSPLVGNRFDPDILHTIPLSLKVVFEEDRYENKI